MPHVVGGHVGERGTAFQTCPAAWVPCWRPTPLTSFQLALSLALQVYSSTQPLRIGYYETDFFTMPSPAMRRAIRETKQLLEDAGHTVGGYMNPTVMLHLFFLSTMSLGPVCEHQANLAGKEGLESTQLPTALMKVDSCFWKREILCIATRFLLSAGSQCSLRCW